MSGKRQKNQEQLAFWFAGASEACFDGQEGTVTPVVEREAESPPGKWQLMEEVVERENLIKALKRVQANDGSPGVDGMTVDESPGYLKGGWTAIREQLMSGTYKPVPVKAAGDRETGREMRKLGTPTVVDRLIQQAVQQVQQKQWDPTFLRKVMAGAFISIWRNIWIGSIKTNSLLNARVMENGLEQPSAFAVAE